MSDAAALVAGEDALGRVLARHRAVLSPVEAAVLEATMQLLVRVRWDLLEGAR